MIRWIAAFQFYALAAEAAEVGSKHWLRFLNSIITYVSWQVWHFSAAMAPLRTCLEIAAGAGAEGKRYSVAIIYDEICRREWHQRAQRGIF